MASDEVVMLDYVQMRKLAKLLLHQEEPLMRSIKSEPERAKYLKQCNDAYDDTITLINISNSMHNKYEIAGNKDKADVAREINEYLKYCINMSMQTIRNFCLRVSCINKTKAHVNSLIADLDGLNPHNVTDIWDMAKDVSLYKKYMWKYTIKTRCRSARAISKAYSSMLKQQGIKFPDLVQRHKNKLGIKGSFENLEDVEKLKVYNSIIEESGRAKIPKIKLAKAAVEIAILVVAAGLMVWDIFTAEHKLEVALRNGLSVLSQCGAFAVSVAVEAAVTTALAQLNLGVFIVSLAGLVAGAVAGLLFMAASGYIIDQIMGTGGEVVPNLDDLKFYSAKMPDGMALAYEITHD